MPALGQFLGSTKGLSAATITRMTQTWQAEQKAFAARDLSHVIAGTRWGTLYFNLATLHHVGRRSGRPYVTPLSAYPLGDGFVLGVAYPHVDWCENLLAAGKCTLTWNGKDYALERPEVIPAYEVMKAYPPLVKFLAVAAGHNKFVWLHRPASQERENVPEIGAGDHTRD